MKKICFVVMLFLTLISSASAACNDDEIIRLSKLANNVNVSYIYNEKTKKFEITFTNVNDELSINDIINNKFYSNYPEVVLKNFNSGKYKFSIYANDRNCYENELISKYIELPYFNEYYTYKECTKIDNYYCNKWLDSNVSYDVWKQKIDEYNKNMQSGYNDESVDNKNIIYILKDIIIKFYVNYYYIILPTIIITLCLIIYLKDKSESII